MTQPREKLPLNILLADDDSDDRFFFEKALDEIPVATKLSTVSDGAHLMTYLMSHLEQLPDVLFLDLNMPRKNGAECLLEIKSNDKLKNIPVVLCSTSLGDDFANQLYHNGATYYLHKCDFADLKKCIRKTFALLAVSHLQPSRDKFMLSLRAM